MEKIWIGIGVIALVLGVKMIFDARPIVKEYFGFGEENEAVLGMKILGFIFSIVGGIILYFNF